MYRDIHSIILRGAARTPKRAALTVASVAALFITTGCADPFMHKSQLPETIDYSGGDSRQAPAVPSLPTTAPVPEVLRPASIPAVATPTAGPFTQPTEPAPSPATQPSPQTGPAALPTSTPSDAKSGL